MVRQLLLFAASCCLLRVYPRGSLSKDRTDAGHCNKQRYTHLTHRARNWSGRKLLLRVHVISEERIFAGVLPRADVKLNLLPDSHKREHTPLAVYSRAEIVIVRSRLRPNARKSSFLVT